MKMPKGVVGLMVLIVLIFNTIIVHAQETIVQEIQEIAEAQQQSKIEGARPDLPGVLGFDLGFVIAPDFKDPISTKIWPSIYFRGYYKWDLFLGNSNFSFHPGISFASETFTFKDNVSFASEPGPNGFETVVVNLDTILRQDADIKRSQFNAVYFGIPLEFTYRTNKEVPKKAFKITVGANFDLRIDSKTRVKYKENGDNKKFKQKEKYDLSIYRINLTARFAYASVGLFYNYSLTPMFNGDKGPLGTVSYPMSFGITFDLF
jgi:hypothetical protein